MKAEEYTERRETMDGWPIHIVTYRIGDKYHCTIDNVDPGARFARAEGTTREDVERVALPVLRHRVLTNFAAEAEGVTAESLIADILAHVPPPKSDIRI